MLITKIHFFELCNCKLGVIFGKRASFLVSFCLFERIFNHRDHGEATGNTEIEPKPRQTISNKNIQYHQSTKNKTGYSICSEEGQVHF